MNNLEKSPRTISIFSAALLIGIFIAGVLTGAGVCRWLTCDQSHHPHSEFGHHGMMGPFSELDLSSDQERQVKEVMEKHRSELEAILHDSFPKVRAVHETIDQEISPFLTPEQQTKLKEIRERRQSQPFHRFKHAHDSLDEELENPMMPSLPPPSP